MRLEGRFWHLQKEGGFHIAKKRGEKGAVGLSYGQKEKKRGYAKKEACETVVSVE